MKKEVQSTFTDLLQTIVNAGFMEDDHTVDRNKFTQIVNDRNFNRVKALYDDAIEKGRKRRSAAYSMRMTARFLRPC